jgi:hypothetical protein
VRLAGLTRRTVRTVRDSRYARNGP